MADDSEKGASSWKLSAVASKEIETGLPILDPKKEPKVSHRFGIGIGISLIWIVAVLLLVYLKHGSIGTMDLNEWGDFFAGVFAPLAFLWLVLGYLQQGDDLRLSTDALRMQAHELNNSK